MLNTTHKKRNKRANKSSPYARYDSSRFYQQSSSLRSKPDSRFCTRVSPCFFHNSEKLRSAHIKRNKNLNYLNELSKATTKSSLGDLFSGSVYGSNNLMPGQSYQTYNYHLKIEDRLDVSYKLNQHVLQVVNNVYNHPVHYCANGDVLYIVDNHLMQFRNVYNAEADKFIKTNYSLGTGGDELRSVSQSTDGENIYLSSNQSLYVLDSQTQGVVYKWNDTFYIRDNDDNLVKRNNFIYVTEPRDSNTFFVGTRKGKVRLVDLREKDKPERIAKVSTQHVTSLSYNGDWQIAAGSNANKLKVYDVRKPQEAPLWEDEFNAAVMGLSYHPKYSKLLAAGDGTKGRTIKLFYSGKEIQSHDTKEQVTGLSWVGNFLLSSHGFACFSFQLRELTSQLAMKKSLPKPSIDSVNSQQTVDKSAEQFKSDFRLINHQASSFHKKQILGLSAQPQRSTNRQSVKAVTLGADNQLVFWNICKTKVSNWKKTIDKKLNPKRQKSKSQKSKSQLGPTLR